MLIAEQIRGALDDLPHPVPVVIVNAGPSPSLAGRGEALPRRSLAVRAGALPGRSAPAAAGDLAGTTGSCRPAPAPRAFAAAAEVRLLDAQGRERVVFGTNS